MKGKFKDGDIVKTQYLVDKDFVRASLIKSIDACPNNHTMEKYYASLNIKGCHKGILSLDGWVYTPMNISLATEEEKEMLIEALKKDGSEMAKTLLEKYFMEEKIKFNRGDIITNIFEDGGK